MVDSHLWTVVEMEKMRDKGKARPDLDLEREQPKRSDILSDGAS